MNRLVLIGNGFDLAHGLKTSYADFIDWYWDYRMRNFINEHSIVSEDKLCSFRILNNDRTDHGPWSTFAYVHNYFNSTQGKEYVGKEIIAEIRDDKQHYEVTFTRFFERILKGIESKNWGGIEEDYYHLLKEYSIEKQSEENLHSLNEQLHYIRELLFEYLNEIKKNEITVDAAIRQIIYSPIDKKDISIERKEALINHIEADLMLSNIEWQRELGHYYGSYYTLGNIEDYQIRRKSKGIDLNDDTIPKELLLPNQIMLLSFNYTNTVSLYRKNASIFSVNHIHGSLENPESIIFGYGDELDEDYKKLQKLGNSECLKNIKSIKYLEKDNYRNALSFIESEPFQVLIMGHSCGNSDRTLLNTIFEHPNCVSIKPYYYINNKGEDNFLELVQNISRNFNDMKLMRDRVVNKTYCEPLPQAPKKPTKQESL